VACQKNTSRSFKAFSAIIWLTNSFVGQLIAKGKVPCLVASGQQAKQKPRFDPKGKLVGHGHINIVCSLKRMIFLIFAV